MNPCERLRERLRGLDGKDFGAYQSLIGAWAFPRFDLHIDRIPKDPHAPPSTGVYRVRVPRAEAAFDEGLSATRIREIALRDFLARQAHRQCLHINKGRRGTGNSGVITIAEPGQQILERTSLVLEGGCIEARFFLGLPAQGRAIRAGIAETMLFDELPRIVDTSLFAESVEMEALRRHVQTAEDAEFLRERLDPLGLVAFVGDGAVLPRSSGVDPRPLAGAAVRPFASPPSLQVRIELPNAGAVSGMGIAKGVTLIVGGGYHGKSTLLQALEAGIYNHIPGDGRERCISAEGTVKVRASSGRSVAGTDISAFIGEIPQGAATTAFSTANASGSTSQAAFIAEAIEAGASVLLMDEDTCATNFMIRDQRMQALVNKAHEPITTFVDRVRELHDDLDISTVLVLGGSGDYFDVADCILQMKGYEPRDVTAEAKDIVRRHPTARAREGGGSFPHPRRRCPLDEGLDPHNEYGHLRVNATDPWRLVFGGVTVDLGDVEQLAETAQTRAIGRAILHARQYMDGSAELATIAARILEEIRREGLDVLDPQRTGDLAQFRGLEFAAVLNRFRNLQVRQAP